MSNKYEKEIEEILKKVEGPPGDSPKGSAQKVKRGSIVTRDPTRPSASGKLVSPRNVLSPAKCAVAGLVLLLLGLLPFFPGFLVWIGLGLLALSYLLFFVKPRSTSYEKRWRGRPIESPSSAWERFLRWLKS